MKNFLFSLLLLVQLVSLSAQDITLTFNGTGESETVDSIIAINQATGQIIRVAGNVLQLKEGISSDINNIGSDAAFKVWPNPFTSETNIIIPVETVGDLNIAIYNTLGQIVASASQKSISRSCKFSFSAKEQGLYILHALVANKNYNASLLCLKNGDDVNLTFIGVEDNDLKSLKSNLKSATSGNFLYYSPGDRVLFKCKSGIHSTIMSAVLNESCVYSVEFVSCTDESNNNYPIVKIGNQIWMAEDLRSTKYEDGDPIPQITDNTVWSELTTPAYCWYNNDEAGYKANYGALYNWYAVNSGKLCPTGWHVPTDDEWIVLTDYLTNNGYGYGGSDDDIAKAMATSWGWKTSSTAGTLGNDPGSNNSSGLSAVPGGHRGSDGTYVNVGSYGAWWSSTENFPFASRVDMYYSLSRIDGGNTNKENGMSVRCVGDESTEKVIPSLTTQSISDITINSANTGGVITNDGGAAVTTRGVCWSTKQNPTTSNSKTNDGTGIGSYTSNLMGLTANKTYYVRAYATNSAGTAYGEQVSFTTSQVITVPVLTTTSAGIITQTTAKSGGNITIDGGAAVTARGVCWSTSQNPTTANSITTDGAGTGNFISNLSGLTAGTSYYVRAYAINSLGTAYGEQVSFTTNPAGIADSDGNVYTTVSIGTQTWLMENLKTTTYNDGTPIPLVTDATAWGALTSPAYCWYYNDEATHKTNYGALYNWYAVSTTTNGGKNVCPTGYHVPTDAEWTVLTDYLTNNGYGYEGSGNDIAKAMAATWGWYSISTAGTPGNDPGSNNSSGFTAVPGGYRSNDGTFSYIGLGGIWWSSTEYSTTNALYRGLYSYFSNVYIDYNIRRDGFSVRCVGD